MMYAPPPILIEIARCESGMRQFSDDGSVIKNPTTKDYGFFQIHYTHIKEATEMGYDVMTPEGNIGYALYLYRTQGTQPWTASKACWSGKPAP